MKITMWRNGALQKPEVHLAMQHCIFDCEDDAAEFIAGVKIHDPDDDLNYVIYGDPPGSERFSISVFAADGRSLGKVCGEPAGQSDARAPELTLPAEAR